MNGMCLSLLVQTTAACAPAVCSAFAARDKERKYVLGCGACHLVAVYDRARLKNSHFHQVDDLACRPRYRRTFLELVYVVYDVYDV